jgi:hypothetical protein
VGLAVASLVWIPDGSLEIPRPLSLRETNGVFPVMRKLSCSRFCSWKLASSPFLPLFSGSCLEVCIQAISRKAIIEIVDRKVKDDATGWSNFLGTIKGCPRVPQI